MGPRAPPGVNAMTKYLFLKSDFSGPRGAKRHLNNAGIDVKLLPLLSARYV